MKKATKRKNESTISEITRKKRSSPLKPEEAKFLESYDLAVKKQSEKTLINRDESNLGAFLDGGLPPDDNKRATALLVCSSIDFDTFWTEVESEGGSRKSLHIVARFDGIPEVHLCCTSRPGSRLPDNAAFLEKCEKVWRDLHITQMIGKMPIGCFWPDEFLQEREIVLARFVSVWLKAAFIETAKRIIEEGLVFDLLPEEDVDQIVKARQIDEAVKMSHRLGIYRYDLSDLLYHYRNLLPIVQDAKKVRTSNRYNDWRKIIFDKYEYMPQSLIERLEKPQDYADSLKEVVAEKGGTSAPRDIALEWAARRCGAPDYHYKLSYLEKKLKELARK